MLLSVLQGYVIDIDELRWFVLDNASNNDTALAELSKTISFDPNKRRLRLQCAGHMINLAAEAFLFGSQPSELNKQIQEEGSDTVKLNLWRGRGPFGKLHNTCYSYHSVYASEKDFQQNARNKTWSSVTEIVSIHLFEMGAFAGIQLT